MTEVKDSLRDRLIERAEIVDEYSDDAVTAALLREAAEALKDAEETILGLVRAHNMAEVVRITDGRSFRSQSTHPKERE